MLLLALSFAAAWFASMLPHPSPAAVALTWLVAGLFVAAVLRVHVVVNAPRRDR
jgi:hypothetical protein